MAKMRQKKCKYCKAQFETKCSKRKYCEDSSCSKDFNNMKRRTKQTWQKRIDRLQNNPFFQWIFRECRRAGTVQILTNPDLPGLFAAYEECRKTYPYDRAKKKVYFQLCHKSPVKGGETIGLLHPENLFIGRSWHNQIQGVNCYEGSGLSITRESLEDRWAVAKNESIPSIKKKLVKFLGDHLVEYAKIHTINSSKKTGLIKKIKKSGKSPFSASELETMSSEQLSQMVADITQKPEFVIETEPKRSMLVYLNQCLRLASSNTSCEFLVPYLRVACTFLALRREKGLDDVLPPDHYWSCPRFNIVQGKKINEFRDWITLTAYEVLAGKTIDKERFREIFLSYLTVDNTAQELANNQEKYQFVDKVKDIYESYRQIWFSVLVVRKYAMNGSSKPSATRPTTISVVVNNTQKGDVITCNKNQVSSKDSVNIYTNIEWITSRIRMVNHLMQSQTQYMMAS